MAYDVRQKILPGFGSDEPDESPSPAPKPGATGSASASTGRTLPDGALYGKTVYAIDSMGLIYQVFHAMPPMTGPGGEPVAAVYGFVRDLFTLLESKRPDFLVCAFDLPGKTFRHGLMEQYKAHRPPMPEDLIPQIETIRRVVETLGVPALGCPSFEADDVLATVAQRTEQLGADCYLVTADKDCRQLIGPRTKVYNLRKDQVLDSGRLAEEWGIRPDQVVDYLTLTGDASDGVPGVPLIGPKYARLLLEQYDNLAKILANAGTALSGKRRENLTAYGPRALVSRQLIALRRDVPVELDWEAARVSGFRWPALRKALADLGFRSLTAKAEGFEQAGSSTPVAK